MKENKTSFCGVQGYLSDILVTFILSLSVTSLCYYCYYLLAPWIWSQNIPFKLEDLTPVMQKAIDQDGIEIYALYILVFVNIICAFALSKLIRHFIEKHTWNIFQAICVLASVLYCVRVGFVPPMNSFHDTPIAKVIPQSLLILSASFLLIALLWYLQQRKFWWGVVLAAIVLAPICFIATSVVSQIDYYFIVAPAQKLLNGEALSNIYFQYDLLPSLLAAAWLKSGFDMNSFQIIGQAAYYTTLLTIFTFSGRLFERKELSAFLLVALVLVRLYASPFGDPCLCFQVTPLRLDLWLPLMLIIYRWGPYHWSAGLGCGLLLLLATNMGIIYSLAYIQLLLTLWGVNYVDGNKKTTVLHSLVDYGKRCAVPLIILVVMGVVSHVILKNDIYGNYSSYYQKIGIGFMKISRESFYWYMPALISLTFILLTQLRKSIPTAHMIAGYFLIYCAIGNSIYFFGRSHENNILNITIVLLFLVFFTLDLVARYFNDSSVDSVRVSYRHQYLVISVASVVIITAAVSYSKTITEKVSTQISNAAQGQLIYPYNPTERDEHYTDFMNEVRIHTNYSDKVYFADELDFFYTYYGGYAPVGYASPYMTWVFRKDLTKFLQGLLDNGYYIVCFERNLTILKDLTYNKNDWLGSHVVVASKNRSN